MGWHSLLLHLIIEVPASLGFLLGPSATLAVSQPAAHAVIRQYGLLLLCTNIIVLLVAELDYIEGDYHLIAGLVAGIKAALALYHVGPLIRALSKLMARNASPWAYMVAFLHGLCGLWLAFDAFCTYREVNA